MLAHSDNHGQGDKIQAISERIHMKTELEKDPSTIGKMFDKISPTYDLLNHMLSMFIDVGWRKQALRELTIQKGEIVLDIASGTGDMAIHARSLYDCQIVGIDISSNMLGTAVEKWGKRFNNHEFSAFVGDALSMPFKDRSFDKAMVAFGIRNMFDIPTFLDEIHRTLKPGGKLAILEFSVPEYPVIRQLYLAYLTKVLPFIGGLQSGDSDAYQYLAESIRRFPSPGSMEKMFEGHGFQLSSSIVQTMCISHLYVLQKQG
jgi:demethylmenaquinone methyltransferase / 2-methoxy-6-polyprenyl-1,4-benzoquinol methylase